jgi:DNA-binding LytR/AlgR family response regulator
MIQIAICDDSLDDMNRIAGKLAALSPFEGQFSVHTYSGGKELLAAPERPFDLIFLDIQMPQIDGYETARKIRETDQNTVLVFLTGIVIPSADAFKVTPFRYLLKQLPENQFETELMEIFTEVNRKRQYITVKSGPDLMRINVDSILYLTIANRSVDIVTDNGTWNVRQKIGEMYPLVAPHGFGYCHKSYLVNFNRILTISGNTVVMESGAILPISQPKAKQFRQEFVRFAGGTL